MLDLSPEELLVGFLLRFAAFETAKKHAMAGQDQISARQLGFETMAARSKLALDLIEHLVGVLDTTMRKRAEKRLETVRA